MMYDEEDIEAMTEVEGRTRLYEAVTNAVEGAILEVGIENFMKCSFFMSNQPDKVVRSSPVAKAELRSN